MPTYEYACSSCGASHEIQQKMTDPTLTECPSCHEHALRKLFTNVGVVFKGSGFYRTDSRESAKKGSDSSSTAGSSPSTKDGGTSGTGAGSSGTSSSTSPSGSSGSAGSSSSSGSSAPASAPPSKAASPA